MEKEHKIDERPTNLTVVPALWVQMQGIKQLDKPEETVHVYSEEKNA